MNTLLKTTALSATLFSTLHALPGIGDGLNLAGNGIKQAAQGTATTISGVAKTALGLGIVAGYGATAWAGFKLVGKVAAGASIYTLAATNPIPTSILAAGAIVGTTSLYYSLSNKNQKILSKSGEIIGGSGVFGGLGCITGLSIQAAGSHYGYTIPSDLHKKGAVVGAVIGGASTAAFGFFNSLYALGSVTDIGYKIAHLMPADLRSKLGHDLLKLFEKKQITPPTSSDTDYTVYELNQAAFLMQNATPKTQDAYILAVQRGLNCSKAKAARIVNDWIEQTNL